MISALLPGVLFFLILSLGGVSYASVHDTFRTRASSYLIEVEGKPVWARNPEKKLPPASLTKIMTALIVIEKARPYDIATVGEDASRETGTRLRLRKGERMDVKSLLEAAMLKSANDACHVLADHVAGSEGAFVEMMNERAALLGMASTRFTNACGHDNPGHYSTARDLAILVSEAFKHREFAETVSMERAFITTADAKRTFRLKNNNRLVGRYPGLTGVKTGFTYNAGKCLIAAAKRDGKDVLVVLLNAPGRWNDAVRMLDKGLGPLDTEARARVQNVRYRGRG